MGYFQVRYDSRVVMYDLRGFIRLATDQVISQSAIQYCCGVGVQRKCFYFESREVKKREDGLEKWFFKTLNSSVAADVVLVVVSRQSKGSTNKMNGCPFTFVTMSMSKVIFWDIFVRPPLFRARWRSWCWCGPISVRRCRRCSKDPDKVT